MQKSLLYFFCEFARKGVRKIRLPDRATPTRRALCTCTGSRAKKSTNGRPNIPIVRCQKGGFKIARKTGPEKKNQDLIWNSVLKKAPLFMRRTKGIPEKKKWISGQQDRSACYTFPITTDLRPLKGCKFELGSVSSTWRPELGELGSGKNENFIQIKTPP